MAQNICVVIGKPRGFTKSVLEALLKRGSQVMMVCSESDATMAKSEVNRLGYSFVKKLLLTSVNCCMLYQGAVQFTKIAIFNHTRKVFKGKRYRSNVFEGARKIRKH